MAYILTTRRSWSYKHENSIRSSLETIHFSVPWILKRGQFFWFYCYLHQLHPKATGLRFSWVGTSRLRTGKSEVAMWLVFRCSIIITSELIPECNVFLCSTRLSQQVHPYVVDWPVECTIPCEQNSLFSRIIRMRNYLGADVITFWIWKDEKRKEYRKIITSTCK